jgi:hypothetical protein
MASGGTGKFKLSGESERGVCNMITNRTHIAYMKHKKLEKKQDYK